MSALRKRTAAPFMPLAEGTKLGRYKILSPLGAGGMAEVYLARDQQLGRSVALKLLSEKLAIDDSHLHRFQQEARAASSLNHPNILTIYEIGDVGATHFIATELVEGDTLRRRLRKSRLNLRDALEISIQVCAALTAAHSVGIVHRDIKPENIMVRNDGLVKVVDFGLAKLAERPAESTNSDPEASTVFRIDTEPGAVMGTTRYMSPEQVRGLSVDMRTDIWSLGVTIYEMITGVLPFDGPTIGDVIVSILEREPVPIDRYVREASPELSRIVSKTLTKDVKERYQRAQDLMNDLRRLVRYQEAGVELAIDPAHTSLGSQPNATTAVAPGIFHSSGRIMSSSGAISLPRKRRTRKVDSIAVLPLTNVSGDPETEYLADGITETIINTLSRLPKLRVMARSTVFRYKGKEVDPQQVGFDLGIRAVLMGRVLQRADDLVIKTELIDVADGSHLWGEQYNRKLSDILAVQEEIATEISEKLRFKLTTVEKKKLTRRYTENIEAYNLYLKGRYYWNKRNGPDLIKGLDYFRQAIDIDPNYALAYAGLADSYTVLAAWNIVPSNDAFPKSKAAASKALEIDKSLSEVHASLGFVRGVYDWDWSRAEKEFKRAIDLNPTYATTYEWYALCLSYMGRHKEAIATAKRAQQLDPLTLIISSVVGVVLHYAHQYKQAVDEYRKILEMDPNFLPARTFCGAAYTQLGMHKEAIAEQRACIAAAGKTPLVMATLGYALARAGDTEGAEQTLRELRELGQQRYVSPFFLAQIHGSLGQVEETLDCLEKACEERFHRMASIKVDSMLDPVREHPRFQRLLEKVGLSDKQLTALLPLKS
jgi:eukaryotic-like serine/threonine-protein kinase